jgi:hypothetical protein
VFREHYPTMFNDSPAMPRKTDWEEEVNRERGPG